MDNVWCWLTHTQKRVFKGMRPEAAKGYRLDLGQGDKGSFQACIRRNAGEPVKLSIAVFSPDKLKVRVRRVGHVPLQHFNSGTPDDELDGIGFIPGFIPDPLFDDTEILFPRNETESFWISVKTDQETPAGIYPITVKFYFGDKEKREAGSLEANVHVHPLVIKPRENFNVAHWFYSDALIDWYKLEPFSEGFWDVCRRYMRDLIEHGNNVMYVQIFTPPVNGMNKPLQALKVRKAGKDKEGNDLFSFEWSDVKRWIDEAKACGFMHFLWTHLFSQWGAKFAVRVFENYDGQYEGRQLWPTETPGTDPVYYNFLKQFFPEFKRFLESEGILEGSFFHLSDEPIGEEALKNYRSARAMVRELAPWINTVVDGVNAVEYGKEDTADIPISGLGTSLKFYEMGVPRWDYYCCGPRGRWLNRLMDMPLPKIRGTAWIFYRFESVGFGHWGYNFWYKMSDTQALIDPYTVFDGLGWDFIPYGDTFVVYPGPNGSPVDSVRWEVFSESFADYQLLQTLGIDPKSPLLSAIRSYEDYPKDHSWYNATRLGLLTSGSK